ncbi:MAG TPA: IS1634 family transposase [Xanthobacteraceae bacterium]|jgi:transposase|nr:IS1634 family transposase [Xanthobacteraceae bacterium]
MYIESVPNRNSPPAILLRESYREDGKVRKRTLCNLSDWPKAHIEGLRGVLKGGTVIPTEREAFTITRSLPHGHVGAALGTAHRIGLDRILGPDGNRCRDLVLAMIVGRILDPASKLAAARALSPATATSSLGTVLGLGEVDEDELYAALDWLLERQPAIETALARRHLKNGTLVLYDVSSSYMEGRCCPIAQRGYSRDGRRGTLQIVYGLLCAPDGCPVAIQVFEGNTGDPMTLAAQVEKLKQRFALDHVVLVGDRGMITQARLTEDIKAAGLDWITALRAPAIQELVKGGALQLSLFDQRDMAAITSPDFPGERLIVCRNPDLAAQRTRKRQELLAATERDLARIQAAVGRQRKPLRGAAQIALAVGAVIEQHKMRKHFELAITDHSFVFARKTAEIAAEAATDGIYIVRTGLSVDVLDDAATVRSYKSLSQVERAFRCIKTVDLHLRPIYHWLADRVRAHVFLCMLAYYLEWHMRQELAPMLFDDTDKEAAEATRPSVVAPAQRSEAAIRKQTTGVTPDGLPVHSFRTLLADLATLTRNTIVTAIAPALPLIVLARPTPVQRRAYELLQLAL